MLAEMEVDDHIARLGCTVFERYRVHDINAFTPSVRMDVMSLVFMYIYIGCGARCVCMIYG